MDFQFDQSQITIIGSKLLNLSSPDGEGEGGVGTAERRSAAEGASLSPGASVSESSSSGWKRPQLSQVRGRLNMDIKWCYVRILIFLDMTKVNFVYVYTFTFTFNYIYSVLIFIRFKLIIISCILLLMPN